MHLNRKTTVGQNNWVDLYSLSWILQVKLNTSGFFTGIWLAIELKCFYNNYDMCQSGRDEEIGFIEMIIQLRNNSVIYACAANSF